MILAVNALFAGFSEAMAPPDERPIADWAAENVQLVGGKGAFFDPDVVPGQRQLFDWFRDPEISQINAVWPTGAGKSVWLESLQCWIVSESPCDCQFSHQTDKPAIQWLEKRVYPALKACRKTAPIMDATHRHKTRKDEMTLANGCTSYFGGANMANLQDKSLPVVCGQEMHDWRPGMIAEAKARTHDRFDAKIVLFSQGAAIGHDFHSECLTGEQFESGYKCPKCRKVTTFLPHTDDPCADFESVFDYDRDLANASEIPWQRLDKTIRYVSPCCGHRWTDTPTNRRKLALAYRTVKRETDGYVPGIVTHTQTAIGLYWIPWSKQVREYLIARRAETNGDGGLIAAFVKKRMARHWAERVQTPDLPRDGAKYIKADYWPAAGELPRRWEQSVFRFMTIDMQLDHYWAVVRDWRLDMTSRLIWEGRIETLEKCHELQLRLGIENNNVAIDSGYDPERAAEAKQKFRQPIQQNGREVGAAVWILMKGDKCKGFTTYEQQGRRQIKHLRMHSDPVQRTSSNGINYVQTMFSALLAKDRLSAQIKLGRLQIPRDVSEAYLRQMKSEHKIIDAGGEPRWIVVSRNAPNHLWDCETLQVVLASMKGILRHDQQAEEKG